jgi:hypothetical protein
VDKLVHDDNIVRPDNGGNGADDTQITVVEEIDASFCEKSASAFSRLMCSTVLPLIMREPIGPLEPQTFAASTAASLTASFSAKPR